MQPAAACVTVEAVRVLSDRGRGGGKKEGNVGRDFVEEGCGKGGGRKKRINDRISSRGRHVPLMGPTTNEGDDP